MSFSTTMEPNSNNNYNNNSGGFFSLLRSGNKNNKEQRREQLLEEIEKLNPEQLKLERRKKCEELLKVAAKVRLLYDVENTLFHDKLEYLDQQGFCRIPKYSEAHKAEVREKLKKNQQEMDELYLYVEVVEEYCYDNNIVNYGDEVVVEEMHYSDDDRAERNRLLRDWNRDKYYNEQQEMYYCNGRAERNRLLRDWNHDRNNNEQQEVCYRNDRTERNRLLRDWNIDKNNNEKLQQKSHPNTNSLTIQSRNNNVLQLNTRWNNNNYATAAPPNVAAGAEDKKKNKREIVEQYNNSSLSDEDVEEYYNAIMKYDNEVLDEEYIYDDDHDENSNNEQQQQTHQNTNNDENAREQDKNGMVQQQKYKRNNHEEEVVFTDLTHMENIQSNREIPPRQANCLLRDWNH